MSALVPSLSPRRRRAVSKKRSWTAVKRPAARAWWSAVDPLSAPGLKAQSLEVVVELEGLDPLADGPRVAGHHRGAVERLDASRPPDARRCACRHSGRGPNRSTGARRPGSWRRPGDEAAGRPRRARRAAGAGGGARAAKCSATVMRLASMRRRSSRRSPSAHQLVQLGQ